MAHDGKRGERQVTSLMPNHRRQTQSGDTDAKQPATVMMVSCSVVQQARLSWQHWD